MDVHESIARITSSVLFKEWFEKNKNCFLAHLFVMLDEANKDTIQAGFYNPETEKMTTFMLTGSRVQKIEEQEVLKKEGRIQKLEPSKIKLTIDEALKKAKKAFDKYKETPIKTFFIIQNAEEHTMYNITYMTQTLKTVNIKIDAETGEIFKQSSQKLIDFPKQ